MSHHTSLVCLHRKFWAAALLCWSQIWGLSSMCSLSRVQWEVAFWFGFGFFPIWRKKYNPKIKQQQFCDSLIHLCSWSCHFPQKSEHTPFEPLGRCAHTSTHRTSSGATTTRFGVSGNWLVQQIALQNPRKQNDPCLLIFQVWNLPPDTLIFYTNNLYPHFVWGNKMGGKTNFKSEQIKMV